MPRALLRDLPLKLLALVLAIALWLRVAGEPVVERHLDVPLGIQNVPAGLELVEVPEAVAVRVRGASSIVSSLAPGDVMAILDLTDEHPGPRRLFDMLSAGRLQVPFGVEVTRVVPPTIAVGLERTGAPRAVPIAPEIDGRPAAGFVVAGISTVPHEIEVVGPERRLAQVVEAVTEPVSIAGASARVRATVAVAVTDPLLRLVGPRSVEVTVEVAPGANRAPARRAPVGVRVAERRRLRGMCGLPEGWLGTERSRKATIGGRTHPTMSTILFGTDGVRGAPGRFPLDAATIVRLGAALAEESGAAPRIVVGRDTRESGEWIERRLVGGIRSAGGEAVGVGVLPTPGVAFLAARGVRRRCRDLGVAQPRARQRHQGPDPSRRESPATSRVPDRGARGGRSSAGRLAAGRRRPRIRRRAGRRLRGASDRRPRRRAVARRMPRRRRLRARGDQRRRTARAAPAGPVRGRHQHGAERPEHQRRLRLDAAGGPAARRRRAGVPAGPRVRRRRGPGDPGGSPGAGRGRRRGAVRLRPPPAGGRTPCGGCRPSPP